MLTAKANTLCLLSILREFSDSEHIMTKSEIISKMESIYGLHITRKTMYSCLAVLIEMGYDISIYEENKIGYYLDSREFDQAEVRLLMDCVYSNTAISSRQSEKLIKKLQTFLPYHKRRNYRNLSIVETSRKTQNNEVFLNIEVLDEAISKKKKVEFTYTQYTIKKELQPKYKTKYKVSPYAMVASNDGYYLFCTTERHTNISIYRIDKIKDIDITDEKIIPPPDDFNPPKYIDESVFMYSSKRVEARIKCDNSMIGHVIDKFGKNVRLYDNEDGTFTVTVTGAFDGLKIWATHYLTGCEIIAPKELRDSVIDMIKQNRYGV